MQRIGEAGGLYIDGNPATNTKGTIVTAAWLNAVQEELAAIVTGLGGALDPLNNAQIIALLQAAMVTSGQCQQNQFSVAVSTGGTVNAITAVYNPPVTALTDGMVLFARPANVNTTTAPTFTPAAGVVPAYTITKGANTALVAGDTSGWIGLQWNATLSKWVLLNPATCVLFGWSTIPRYKNWQAQAIGISNFNVVISADSADLVNSTGQVYTANAVSKTINANGTVGAPLSITSARAAGTFYYIWLWRNVANGVTATLDISSTAPTAPTGYVSGDYKARMPGFVLTDSSGSKYLMQTKTIQNLTTYVELTGSNTATLPALISGGQAVWTAALWTAYAPPTTASLLLTLCNIGTGATSAAPNNMYGTQGSTNAPVLQQSLNNSGSIGEFVPESNYVYYGCTGNGYLALYGSRDSI